MTHDEFLEIMGDLKAVVPKSWDKHDEESKAVLNNHVWRKCRHLPLSVFRKMMDHIIETHTANRAPKLFDFIKAQQAVTDKHKDVEAGPKGMTPAEHHRWLYDTARGLSKTGAAMVLAGVEAGKCKPFPDDVMAVLIDKAEPDEVGEGPTEWEVDPDAV